MKKFVLLYRGTRDQVPTQESTAAWIEWFGSLGDKVVDAGNPFGQGRGVSADNTTELAPDVDGAVFDHCDLSRATFDNTSIERDDFRTSYNYSIDPERNRIKKAKFTIFGISGLLDKYDIHIENDG